MKKEKVLKYSWGSWDAEIRKHSRRDEYVWSVSDKGGDDTYDLYSDIDSELETLAEAEEDMFMEIRDRIGHCPDPQVK